MRKRTIVGLAGISLLLIVGARVSWRIHRAYGRWHEVQSEFHSVEIGQSRLTVISKLGHPNYHAGPCGEMTKPLPACALEYIYGDPVSPLFPQYYIVSFSADDKVIKKTSVASP